MSSSSSDDCVLFNTFNGLSVKTTPDGWLSTDSISSKYQVPVGVWLWSSAEANNFLKTLAQDTNTSLDSVTSSWVYSLSGDIWLREDLALLYADFVDPVLSSWLSSNTSLSK